MQRFLIAVLMALSALGSNPVHGRFLSADPITTDSSTGENFNRYWYANNNPHRFTDPDGRIAFLAVPIVFGIGALLHSGPANPPPPGGHLEQTSPAEAMAAALPPARLLAPASVLVRASTPSASNAGSTSDKKQRNAPPGPDPSAHGAPHSRIERPGTDGQYTTHNGDGTYKQYRGAGQDHGGIPRPNVKETVLNTAPDGKQYPSRPLVRPARPEEVPGG